MSRKRFSELSYEERKKREQAELEAELRELEMTKEETYPWMKPGPLPKGGRVGMVRRGPDGKLYKLVYNGRRGYKGWQGVSWVSLEELIRRSKGKSPLDILFIILVLILGAAACYGLSMIWALIEKALK